MSHINYRKRPELKFTDTIKQMPVTCANELAAVEFIERTRWGECPCCPRCGDTDVLQLRDKQTGGWDGVRPTRRSSRSSPTPVHIRR